MSPERNPYCQRLGLPVPALSGFDLLAGLHIRETLHALRLDPDRWRLADLAPPQKSRRLNRRGRTLKITSEMLIWSTTGIARPLGDPEKVARYLTRGEAGKLARRLESYEILNRARQAGALVDVVVGPAPGWTDPWSRALRVEVANIGPWVVMVRQGTEEIPLDRREIQAVRIVTDPGNDRATRPILPGNPPILPGIGPFPVGA